MNLITDEIAPPQRPASSPLEKSLASAGDSRPPSRRRRRIVTALVLLVIGLILGAGFWNISRRLAPELSAPGSADSVYVASFPERSIAVLPFENLDNGRQEVPIADGVHDDILTALSKIADLRVISATSVGDYRPGGRRDLREIAQSLGAAYILEGSVHRIGEKARITTQFTDARRGSKLWAISYEREVGDILGRQSELVQRIADQLQARISPSEQAAIDQRPTHDLVAYVLYVRGKALISTISYNAQINEQLTESIRLLDQAIVRDPNFYLAYCQLAAAHNYLYFFGLDHTPARLASAEAALKTVERLRPKAAETHLARANFFYRCHLDYEKARAELALAQRDLPNNSEIFELTGYIDRRQGLWKESARSLQRARDLDPRNASLLQQIAASYQETRQFGSMAAALDRALVLAPRDLDTRITRALVEFEWRADTRPLHETIDALLAEDPESASALADLWLYMALSERDSEAIARAAAAIPEDGIATDLNFPRAWCEGLAARAQGDIESARTHFLAARAELEKKTREQPGYGPAFIVLGLIDAGLGRKADAIREGRRAIELLPVTKDSMDGAELMKYLGVIYAWCGEKDLALEQIAKTLRVPGTLSYGNLRLHPNWDTLRGDPRFEKMVAALAPKN